MQSIKHWIERPILVLSISIGISLIVTVELMSSLIRIYLKMTSLSNKYYCMSGALDEHFRKLRIDIDNVYFSPSSSILSETLPEFSSKMFKASLMLVSPKFV